MPEGFFRKVHPAWAQSRMDHANTGTGHPHAREHGRGARPAARVVEQSRLARLPHVPAGVPCAPFGAAMRRRRRAAGGGARLCPPPPSTGRGRKSVHVDVGRAAVAQAGLFEESGASGPAPVVLVAHGRGGQQSADVLGDDERRPEDADALRVVEPQSGAGAALEPRAPSGGGHALAAEAARHDVHVAQGVPVHPGDVLQVGDVGVSVGEHGAWAGVYVGDGDDPRAAERPLDGQVKPAVAGEQAYHSRFVVHAVRYASRGMRAGSGRKHSRSPPKFAQETKEPRHSDVLKTLE